MHNIQPTFLIYDYETFGLDPALDRPAQFAVIRVNHALHVVEEPKCFYCRIPNDYLPSPESVLITGITPQFTIQHGYTESEFALRIFNIFNVPNTCIIGYNNISFDDEFSRNIFYRNFIDPYAWSYYNGNSRWDLLPILRTFYSLFPKTIRWPIKTNHQISFKLTDITHANSIQHTNAHNATSDVYATLNIMRLLKTAQPQLFQFLYNYRSKHQLKTIIDLDTMSPLLYISNTMNDKHTNFINFVAPIAWHPTNRNILITYNLNNNIDNLLSFNINTISRNLNCGQKNIFYLLNQVSLQFIRLNACPILIPINLFNKNHNIFNCIENPFDTQKSYSKNLIRLQLNINKAVYLKINKLCIIIEWYLNQKKILKQTHVDNQLYDKFFNYKDQKIIKQIRNSNIETVSKIDFNGMDSRLKSLLFFYRARNFNNTLNKNEKQTWIDYQKNNLFETKKYSNYINKIDTILFHQNQTQNILPLLLLKKYYKYFYNTIAAL